MSRQLLGRCSHLQEIVECRVVLFFVGMCHPIFTLLRTTNLEHQRPTRLGHPPQRRLRILRHHLPSLPNQPGQRRRIQRHRLYHSRRDP